MDKMNDFSVGSAACCAVWLQLTDIFNAGLTVVVSLLTAAYVGLRVYREIQKIRFYKKKGGKRGKNK